MPLLFVAATAPVVSVAAGKPPPSVMVLMMVVEGRVMVWVMMRTETVGESRRSATP